MNSEYYEAFFEYFIAKKRSRQRTVSHVYKNILFKIVVILRKKEYIKNMFKNKRRRTLRLLSSSIKFNLLLILCLILTAEKKIYSGKKIDSL